MKKKANFPVWFMMASADEERGDYRHASMQAETQAEKVKWPPTARTTARHTSKLRYLKRDTLHSSVSARLSPW